jgi:hypothetical protein
MEEKKSNPLALTDTEIIILVAMFVILLAIPKEWMTVKRVRSKMI